MTSVSTVSVRWRKSSHSTNGGNCVEVGDGIPGVVPVRDSKDSEGPALTFTADAWTSFVQAVKADEIS